MPTADRRPRRRVRPTVAEPLDYLGLLERARTADLAEWDGGLRRDLVRCLVEQRGLKPDDALALAAAFERKPMYIPAAPPSNAKGSDL